jgi:serine protease Do
MLATLTVLALGAALLAPQAAQARSTPDSFADLAEKLLPAVVNISTTQIVESTRVPDQIPGGPGGPFEEFFKEFFNRDGQPRRATSLGSGFIVDPSGIIVTNNHVIGEADEITVILQDDTTLDAELIGRDPKTDLAVLRVKPKDDLPYVKFGDSDELRIGDWVLAIGNPFGLGGSVTAGIVSARARVLSGPYDDYIQTDAPINKGNSGGPLFNLDGQVVGINTAIFSPSGGNVGIAFAVPANLAKSVVDQLIEYGRTRRGWLGVRIQDVSDEIAESLGLDEPRGALVASVTPESPAADAGIEAGDVILEFDHKKVGEMRELPRIVAETDIDKDVEVKVWRNGERRSLTAQVGELDESEDTQTASVQPDQDTGGQSTSIDAFGLSLAPINGAARQRYELDSETTGVLVTDVSNAGPAARKGIRPGDVIVEVAQQKVETPAEVQSLIDAAEDEGQKSVLLLLERRGELRFVALRIDRG